jgi:hypothetical protein
MLLAFLFLKEVDLREVVGTFVEKVKRLFSTEIGRFFEKEVCKDGKKTSGLAHSVGRLKNVKRCVKLLM